MSALPTQTDQALGMEPGAASVAAPAAAMR